MHRLVAKAKENVHHVCQATTQWTQQKMLAAVTSHTPGEASESITDDHTLSRVQQCHKDPHRIIFQALPQQTHPNIRDTNKINIASVKHLGQVHSTSTYVKRDLGFQGQIGPYILLSYGDTLYTDEDYSDTFRGIVSNSIAFATQDPTVVVDTLLDENGYPRQFVRTVPSWGEDQSTHAIGITSVIETGPDEGIIFTLLNHRPNGTDNLLGAGLAKVSLDKSTSPPTPTATRPSPYIWNGTTEPWYGDVCAFKSPLDNFIYAYGHKKDSPYVYLARVHATEAFNPNCYQYFHGAAKGWKPDRLLDSSLAPTSSNTNTTTGSSTSTSTSSLGEEEAIFWQINQGQIIYSPHFQRFLFIYCDNFWSSSILLRWSLVPEGPWSAAQTIYKATPVREGGNVYAAAAHPYLDPDGASLVVTFTNYPNVIEAVRVVFG